MYDRSVHTYMDFKSKNVTSHGVQLCIKKCMIVHMINYKIIMSLEVKGYNKNS